MSLMAEEQLQFIVGGRNVSALRVVPETQLLVWTLVYARRRG